MLSQSPEPAVRLETDAKMSISKVGGKKYSGLLEKSLKRSNLGKEDSDSPPSLDPEADDGITPLTTSCVNWRKEEEDPNVGERT